MMVRLLVVTSLVATVSTTALAQRSPTDRARMHFQAGSTLVAERRFDAAYTEFRSGFELSGRPLFLFNMAECARELGLAEDARRDYEAYLARDPNGPQAATARERLAALPPAPVVVPPPRAPVSAPIDAPIPSSNEAGVAAGTTRPVPVANSAPVIPVSSRADAPRDSRGGEIWEDWPFWTIVGAVVAAGVVTTVVVATSQGGTNLNCMPPMCMTVDVRNP